MSTTEAGEYGSVDVAQVVELAPQAIAIAAMAPLMVGCCIHILLTGIIFTMMGRFVSKGLFKRESLRMQIIVIVVFILNLLQLCISVGDIIYWSSTQERDYDHFFDGTKMDALTPGLVAIMAFLVQGTYAHRAFKLFKVTWRKWLFAITVFLVMIAAVFGGLVTTILNFGYVEDSFDSLGLLDFDTMTSLWLWSSFVADILISIVLWALFRSNITAFNPKTDFILAKLGSLAIQSALYTAVTAMLGAICSEAFTTDYTLAISYLFLLILPALYTISLFITLSAKTSLNRSLEGRFGSQQRPPSMQTSYQVGSFAKSGSAPIGNLGADTRTKSVMSLEVGSAV